MKKLFDKEEYDKFIDEITKYGFSASYGLEIFYQAKIARALERIESKGIDVVTYNP